MELVNKEKEPVYTIKFTEEELKQVIYSYIVAEYANIKLHAEEDGVYIEDPKKYDYISADLKKFLVK